MIILDNIVKQFGIDENFQPFTEKVQILFDELKEKFPNIIRVKIDNELLTLEKEENGLSGILEEIVLPTDLKELVEEAFKKDPIIEPVIEDANIIEENNNG